MFPPGVHHLRAQSGRLALSNTGPSSPPSSGRTLGLQSSGFLVHFPLGQSEALIAAHWAVQLIPFPQVTLVKVELREQQPTSIVVLEKVKEESKKLMSNSGL